LRGGGFPAPYSSPLVPPLTDGELEEEDKDAVAIQARKAVVMDFLKTLPDD
jgi:hypothetical protein